MESTDTLYKVVLWVSVLVTVIVMVLMFRRAVRSADEKFKSIKKDIDKQKRTYTPVDDQHSSLLTHPH